MASVSDAYESVADTDLWTDVAAIFIGFFVPLILRTLVESSTSFDTYDELYGFAIIVAAEFVAGDMKRDAQVGAGVYAADQFSERIGAKGKLINFAQGV